LIEQRAGFMRETGTKSTVDGTIESARTQRYGKAHAEDERDACVTEEIAKVIANGIAKVTEANWISMHAAGWPVPKRWHLLLPAERPSVSPIERKPWRMRYPVRDLKYLTRRACI
jgi:hypothetical protein